VQKTGIDLLAVSVGNIHVLLDGRQDLNLDHLAAIHDAVDAPLVLHGGTGISAGSIREAIRLGVTKVNYGTYVKQRYLAALRAALDNPDPNPHHLLGYGGEADVMVAGRRAVRDAVLERIEYLNCVGKG
jgi:fructose/tagatose bisphosphate aldolase